MNMVGPDVTCMHICQAARELWQRGKKRTPDQPLAFPLSTNETQGPFPLQGGGKLYVLPLPPTPTQTPTPNSSQGLAEPTTPSLSLASLPGAAPALIGPFSSIPGADISSTADGVPPDVSADVSPTQQVEFVNGADVTNTKGGVYVWDKNLLFIQSTDPVTFWCKTPGLDGFELLGCTNTNGVLGESLHLTDTQIGYDPALGVWLATELAINPTTKTGVIYFAASTTSDATGSWKKWWNTLCTDPNFPTVDQPLLGWTGTQALRPGLVAIDVKCLDAGFNSGPDNLFLIPNSTITSSAIHLPPPIATPCSSMTPSRDENNTFADLLFLVAPIVPTTANLTNCAPASTNTEPYVVQYTAKIHGGTGVFGSGGCTAGTSGCQPSSISFQAGNPGTYGLHSGAQQLIAPAYAQVCATSNVACDIDLEDARIKAAQIRISNLSGVQTPLLSFGFDTGIFASGPGIPLSQNLWFNQSLGSGTSPGIWLNAFLFAAGDQWMAFPTIALDNDQDFYFGSTNFQTTIFPQTIWDAYKNLTSPQLLGQNVLESSVSTYTGRREPRTR